MREDLPTGTVTFLFTDVEGSTRLLHELGAELYAEALAGHRRAVRDAVGRHEGVEVDTQGDAFFVAFPTAPGALAAAREAQEALGDGLIRVRMGVHTGTPFVGEEGYVGVDVHRAARIAAAGHGGQVLVSQSTAALVPGADLHDLGEHRLKDLAAAERVYQLGGGTFPPLASLHRTNLPVPATPFLGRARELAAVVELLENGARLVTLTGPGGTGKTRLSVQAAAEVADRYRDGVFWVPLAPIRDRSLVLATVAHAIGAREEPGRSPLESLAEECGGKRLLVVLDNAEHLMPELGHDVAALLASAPTVALVVTSRERLRIGGEQVYPVPTLAAGEGVELFTTRARAAEPSFVRTPAVEALCERLDNLPLAIELAAARTGLLSPEQLLERLGRRLDMLKGGRGVDPRQETLRATIGWSYELLGEVERRAFARMSVFVGGCTLEAAEEVCDADLDTLESLLDKSLLRRRDTGSGPRLWMLETIREFAAEELASLGEAHDLARAHLDHYLRLVRETDEAQPGAEYDLDRIDTERDNLRLALDTALASDRERAVDLAGRLGIYWLRRGGYAEGRKSLAAALAVGDGAAPLLRARALLFAALLALEQGDFETTDGLAQAALGLFRESGDLKGEGRALNTLGLGAWYRGALDEATRLLEQAAAAHRAVGNEEGELGVLANLAAVTNARGDHRLAAEILGEVTQIQRDRDHPSGLASGLNNLGLAQEAAGERELARASFEESVAVARRHGLVSNHAYALASLAHLVTGSDPEAALAYYHESLERMSELSDLRGMAYCFEGLARVALRLDRPEHAALLLGAADGIRNRTGTALDREEHAEVDRTTRESRLRSGEDAFAAAWKAGARLSSEEAVGHALADGRSVGTP